MCVVELEQCELWVETERKAKKRHKCSCCWGFIEPGAKYHVHFSKQDGEVTSEKICSACHTDRGVFGDAHEGMVPTPSYFPQLLLDCIGDSDDDRWQSMFDRIRAVQEAQKLLK